MLIFSTIALLVIGTLLWFYVFSIYEVRFVMSESRDEMGNRLVSIHPVPLNSLGKPAPFRYLQSKYEILSGGERISEYVEDEYKFNFVVQSDSGSAITIKAVTDLSLYDTVLEIK